MNVRSKCQMDRAVRRSSARAADKRHADSEIGALCSEIGEPHPEIGEIAIAIRSSMRRFDPIEMEARP
jgi:hypothetical protein